MYGKGPDSEKERERGSLLPPLPIESLKQLFWFKAGMEIRTQYFPSFDCG